MRLLGLSIIWSGHNKSIAVPERKQSPLAGCERSLCMWLSSFYSMDKFFIYRKIYGYVAIILIVLLMSWEYQKVDAALMEDSIPEEAIRLRILAHSDSPTDQVIKAIVRDRIVEKMNEWGHEAQSIEEARIIVQQRLDEFERIIGLTLDEYGYSYKYKVELKEAEFPTKVYGTLVYSAGLYETLLITLGDGNGRNWWCVLFPPLCFTDAVKGEASPVQADIKENDEQSKSKKSAKEHNKEHTVIETNEEEIVSDNLQKSTDIESTSKVQVKFFLADAWSWIKGWFI